jgi:hypothetical protein
MYSDEKYNDLLQAKEELSKNLEVVNLPLDVNKQ